MSAPKRRQCDKCPWKATTDPYDIPNGYSLAKHRALADTIADPGSLRGVGRTLRVFACHETTGGAELACVGWLVNQIGPGNNIALRLQAITGRFGDFETVGPQRDRFEGTLPRSKRRRSP